MALSDSDAQWLAEAMARGGNDWTRELVQWMLQQLTDAEAAQVIGARPWERTEQRSTHRNGYRSKVLSTRAGDVQVAIPKLRSGSYFPSFLAPRRRIDQALYAVIMEAWVSGVSTRAVDDLVAAMGVTSGVSKSEVSRICEQLDVTVNAFRDRTLGHADFPYVFLDATYLHVRDTDLGQVVSRPVKDLGPDFAAIVPLRNVNAEVAARAIADREARHRQAMLDSMLDPHVLSQAVRDESGVIVDFIFAEANEAACDYNRMPRQGLVGKSLLDLFPGIPAPMPVVA